MVDAAQKPLVTITGISGYIGSHVALLFLQDGSYRVRGTVRDPSNQSKVAPIQQAFGAELFGQLELVQADLTDEASLASAVAGSTFVVHVASPIAMFQTEDEYVRPAVDGTLGVLRACKSNGVQRCVITSSVASCGSPIEAEMPANGIIDESVWSEIKATTEGALQMYCKSKILAEKAAWDFQAALPEAEKFEIVTILPSFVMGPALRADWFASGDWLRRCMTGAMTEIPSEGQAVCDVRDVAFAHMQAIKVPAAANRRFIIVHSSPSYSDYARPVIAKYEPLGWPFSKVFAAEDPEKKTKMYDNTASREVLGLQYHDFPTTMVEMADSMVALGSIKMPVAAQE